MTVRNALLGDLDNILGAYRTARRFMAETGNPSQWADFYPPEELVRKDIEGGNLYVIEENSELCGVFAFFPEGDPAYDEIIGTWLNDLPHAAIHRVASTGIKKGVIAECVRYCLTRSNNLKIDTYKDNKVMQHQLQKYGFVPCGTLKTEHPEEYIAFQLYSE